VRALGRLREELKRLKDTVEKTNDNGSK